MKRLVVCFDGTWNSEDAAPGAETNVARIARAIHASKGTNGVLQIVLYLRGVGSTGSTAQRYLQGATGQGVDDNIRSAYMFLAQNYLPGDEIFLFGFSRGAFTARSLGGFIGSCGLLKRQNLGDLAKAWNYYRKEKTRSPPHFCASCSSDSHQNVTIAFLGVWDTVGALGVPSSVVRSLVGEAHEFHDTTPSRIVKRAYHALAIDEHRDEFVPTLWTGNVPDGATIEQVWFAGAHSDVGGGYPERALADIPLLWMADKAAAAGLALDDMVLPTGAPDPLAPRHDSRTGVFKTDKLRPTYRCVAGYAFPVTPIERLYAPLDQHGKPLTTINESIHPSVFARIGQPDTIHGQPRATAAYRPRNVPPRS